MTFVRPARRVLIAAAALSALSSSPPVVAAEKHHRPRPRQGRCRIRQEGPITYVSGKDTSGYVRSGSTSGTTAPGREGRPSWSCPIG